MVESKLRQSILADSSQAFACLESSNVDRIDEISRTKQPTFKIPSALLMVCYQQFQ